MNEAERFTGCVNHLIFLQRHAILFAHENRIIFFFALCGRFVLQCSPDLHRSHLKTLGGGEALIHIPLFLGIHSDVAFYSSLLSVCLYSVAHFDRITLFFILIQPVLKIFPVFRNSYTLPLPVVNLCFPF